MTKRTRYNFRADGFETREAAIALALREAKASNHRLFAWYATNEWIIVSSTVSGAPEFPNYSGALMILPNGQVWELVQRHVEG